jgi:hypothetical protein
MLDNVPPGLALALAQEGVPFRYRTGDPPEGRFVLFDSRHGLRRPPGFGQVAIDVDALRDGSGQDPLKMLLDERSRPHAWQIAGLTVTEEIACVDRRALRQRILGALRKRIEQAGGIWLCVAAFPFPYRGALNLRIDYDAYDANDYASTFDVIAGNEEATSHFISGAACEPHPDVLARFRGLDVGSHGYWHHTYLTESENFNNIRRGIEVLRRGGIKPSGFVAPRGRFHRPLLAALEQLQISHSSEFSLAYDDVPFFPQGTDVLQIPVHPICLGLFLDAAKAAHGSETYAIQRAVHAATDYFRQTARSKYRLGEPVFFYGHPTGRLGRYPQVLRAVFDTAESFAAIWKTTLSEFAAWWRARTSVWLTVDRSGDQFAVTADSLPDEFCVGIEYWRDRRVARMPLESGTLRFSPSALAYENRAFESRVRPVRVDRPEGLRGRIRRWIDWERETPIEEIAPVTWRNWAKRTIRRWRG